MNVIWGKYLNVLLMVAFVLESIIVYICAIEVLMAFSISSFEMKRMFTSWAAA